MKKRTNDQVLKELLTRGHKKKYGCCNRKDEKSKLFFSLQDLTAINKLRPAPKTRVSKT